MLNIILLKNQPEWYKHSKWPNILTIRSLTDSLNIEHTSVQSLKIAINLFS